MRSLALRMPVAVAAFAMLLVGAGQTVLADTELGDHGSVGAHSLTDTHSTPGARCDYQFNSGLGLGKLKMVTVHPPNMDASPGRSHQIVGWRFMVEKRRHSEQNGPWHQIYQSPLQTTAIGGEGGGFDSMSVAISVPANEGENAIHQYRVKVKMFWYAKDDMTVVGWSLHRADFYKGVMNTGGHWVEDGWCSGLSPS